MRTVLVAGLAATLAMLLTCLVPAGAAGAATATGSRGDKPAWLTKTIRDRISAKGAKGASLSAIRDWVRAERRAAGRRREQPVPDPCPGSADQTRNNAQAYPGACMVYPAGCTMAFVFKKGTATPDPRADGRTDYLGTAGHCVDHANQPVFTSNNNVVYDIGRVEKLMNGGIGNDFAIVQLREDIRIDPRVPLQDAAGGPQGIYTGCEPDNVKFWGHGYGFAVGPGKLSGGVAPLWFDRSFGWTGPALPGDSGSAVTLDDRRAAGNLTHLVIDTARYPGATTAGTRVTRALTWMGGQFRLVNEDFTTSRATMEDTRCGNADAGSGGGSASVLSSLLG